MKPALICACSFFMVGTLTAQDLARVGVVAITRQRDEQGIARKLASAVADQLQKAPQRVAFAGEVNELPANKLNDQALVGIARSQNVNYLAVVDFDPREGQRGIYSIEVIERAVDKIASRTAVLFGMLATTAANVGYAITDIATRSMSAIAAAASKFRQIRILLSLYVRGGGPADYWLGKSDSRTIDSNGIATWDTLLPVGKAVLKVAKTGFAEFQETIDVPSTKDVFTIRRIIQFKPASGVAPLN
jgi:hypothetical protein